MKWQFRDAEQGFESAKIDSLAQKMGLSRLTIRVCLGRGLDTDVAIRNFLYPRIDHLTDPSRIQDLDQACDRIIAAKEAGEKIRVFGDYDVDGTCGAALLGWVFRELQFNFDLRQPNRFTDGYGLNVRAVEAAVEEGVQLLITVDCGITSFAALERAKELGLATIVIDHHQIDPTKGLPPAFAVVNPQRTDCKSGLKQLCGTGLAFYVAMGLRRRAREKGWFEGGKLSEPNLKKHLDLVLLATAADMVPLTGDNRTLVQAGMGVLKNTEKPGMKALLSVSGIEPTHVSIGHLGFALAPRINASGRLESASLALEMLTTQDVSRAQELAQELERLNRERMALQDKIWDEVKAEVEKGIADGKYVHAVVVGKAQWHEGVVGIVASRVVDMFHRPAAVISFKEGHGKGSVRSFNKVDILEGLRTAKDYLLGFGGHRHAAGLTVKEENLENFARAFDEAVAAEKVKTSSASEALLWIDGLVEEKDLELKTFLELEKLGPFGPGNPEPVIALKARVGFKKILKGRHWKMRLNSLDAIWFHAEDKVKRKNLEYELDQKDSEWALVPEVNRFRGRMSPVLHVKDLR